MFVEVVDPAVDAVDEVTSDSVPLLGGHEALDVLDGVLHAAVVPGRRRRTGQYHDAPLVEELQDALFVEDGAAIALEDQRRSMPLESAL